MIRVRIILSRDFSTRRKKEISIPFSPHFISSAVNPASVWEVRRVTASNSGEIKRTSIADTQKHRNFGSEMNE